MPAAVIAIVAAGLLVAGCGDEVAVDVTITE